MLVNGSHCFSRKLVQCSYYILTVLDSKNQCRKISSEEQAHGIATPQGQIWIASNYLRTTNLKDTLSYHDPIYSSVYMCEHDSTLGG